TFQLRSSTPGSPWFLNYSGNSETNIRNVDVRDSDASSGNLIRAADSTNSSNNVNWQFGGVHSVSGILRDFDGSTPLGGVMAKLAINGGGAAGAVATAASSASGAFNFSVGIFSGDTIAVF